MLRYLRYLIVKVTRLCIANITFKNCHVATKCFVLLYQDRIFTIQLIDYTIFTFEKACEWAI